MKFTFIFPEQSYIKGRFWLKSLFTVEPPVIAKLKSLVPENVECEFFDERIENIKFKTEAELTFPQMLQDFYDEKLQKFYHAEKKCNLANVQLDRSIFKGKRYIPYRHVEVSRGCRYNCNFCTIAKVYEQNVSLRPVDEIIEDIKNIGVKYIGLIDENACTNIEYRKELYRHMIPLKKKWFAQITLKALLEEEFVELMAKSGCFNVFIGMESISEDVLKNMNKRHNIIEEYEKAFDNCVKYNISVSIGTILGYEGDTLENAKLTFEYLNNKQLFMSIFTTFFPIPNTPSYNQLKTQNKLVKNDWWISDEIFFSMRLIKYDVKNEFTGVAQRYFVEYLALKNIFKRFIKSKYRIGMRFFILWFNLFMKYNINAFG